MGGATTQPMEADTSTDAQIPATQEAVLHGLTTARSTRTVSE